MAALDGGGRCAANPPSVEKPSEVVGGDVGDDTHVLVAVAPECGEEVPPGVVGSVAGSQARPFGDIVDRGEPGCFFCGGLPTL